MSSDQRNMFSGLRVTSLATLVSRVLGMLRDVATASLLGMSAGGVMDALVIAFRVPNLFRRLFGEGALAASYLPVLSGELERDRASAWQLASVVFVRLVVWLTVLVALAELACFGIWVGSEQSDRLNLLISLLTVLMPYTILICLTAQLAATLHALSHFRTPALAPVLLNIIWLTTALWIAPQFEEKTTQALALAIAILSAGFFQLAMQLQALWRLGFRFDYQPQRAKKLIRDIVRNMAPAVLGLAVTQINTLADSLIAWGLTSPDEQGGGIGWLGGAVDYPLRSGAAAAIYYGERLYQFPLGILGIAVATVIFPLLSRHAARGDKRQLGADLTIGLRLVLLMGVPASVGLVLLAEPITRLLFERGQFSAEDTRRTARMIACYGWGVWAYCALPVVIRGYYALSMRSTPVRVGLALVGVNLLLNLTLVWPLAEAGLALSTASCAAVQVVVLIAIFAKRGAPVAWDQLTLSAVRTGIASTVMGVSVYTTLNFISNDLFSKGVVATWQVALAAVGPLVVGLIVFLATTWLLGDDVLRLLLGRKKTRK